jgi:TetR/AcrR family transcriptional regulator, lmrAB and yxaGH operons repressor
MGARDRLIDSAVDLVRRHGVAGTGIAELLVRSGVARRSVYLCFPGGKSELICEATRTAGQVYTSLIRSVTAAADPGPDSQPNLASCLAAFVALWREVVESSDFTAGCPIAAAALARADAPDASDAAGETFRDWEQLLAARLRAEHVEPETAVALATTVVAGVEGAVMLSLATRSVEPLERVGQQLSALVSAHTQAGSRSCSRVPTER